MLPIYICLAEFIFVFHCDQFHRNGEWGMGYAHNVHSNDIDRFGHDAVSLGWFPPQIQATILIILLGNNENEHFTTNGFIYVWICIVVFFMANNLAQEWIHINGETALSLAFRNSVSRYDLDISIFSHSAISNVQMSKRSDHLMSAFALHKGNDPIFHIHAIGCSDVFLALCLFLLCSILMNDMFRLYKSLIKILFYET